MSTPTDGLVVDFVGVLRELRKALQFDSSDASGVIEDLDLLLKDFLAKIETVLPRQRFSDLRPLRPEIWQPGHISLRPSWRPGAWPF
jgi:hypothetical protein